MKCTRCGAEASAGLTTEAVELGNGGVLVVRHIPCYRCGHCGEILYAGDVVTRLEALTARAEELVQEVTVVNYAKAS